ncbi:MAG TPA: hypothetical protein VK775_22660 [Chthoniobacterales bacterium]|nr:hypothetical protein [Chthoniobacterales bacterium]
MRCFPEASKRCGWGSPIIGRFRQRSRAAGRLAWHYLWLLLLIDVTTFHKARAQDTGGPRLPPASFQTTVVQGVVAQYLMNPDGFIDGLLLSNNTIIRFPPHLGQVLTQTVSPQDIVRVEGFFESSGTFHASSIIDLQSQRSVADYPPPLGHPPAPRPGSLPRRPLSANGTIRVLTQGKRSEINGVVLADGTVVRFAPTVGMQFAALLHEGNQFAATGYGTSNQYGRSFEATAIGPSINQLEAIAPDPGPKPRPEIGTSLPPSTP